MKEQQGASAQEDKHEESESSLLEEESALSSDNKTTVHKTIFHGPVIGTIHTGSGDINHVTNIFSLDGLRGWSDSIFLWSQAPPHMLSSWAGRILWALTAITNRLTWEKVSTLSVVAAMWIATAWLITPILQWPLDDPQIRLWACLKAAVASLVIPLTLSFLTQADNQSQILIESVRDKRIIWTLKLTGALVGFGVFFGILVFLSLTLYYLALPPFPVLGWGLPAVLPLLFGYIAARRIPADRFKMFGSKLQLHSADKLFLPTFFFFGPLLAGFIYIWHSFLIDRTIGLVMLLVVIGIALWERRKQERAMISDTMLILILGLFLPFLAFLIFFFVSNQIAFDTLPTFEQFVAIILVAVYFIGLLLLWVTLQIRNRPLLTVNGVLGTLFVLVVLNGILQIDLSVGRILTLVVVGLWLLWGQKWYRQYLWIHSSMVFMIAAIGLSLALAVQTAVPLWVNALAFIPIAGLLVWWAYHSSPNTM